MNKDLKIKLHQIADKINNMTYLHEIKKYMKSEPENANLIAAVSVIESMLKAGGGVDLSLRRDIKVGVSVFDLMTKTEMSDEDFAEVEDIILEILPTLRPRYGQTLN